MECITLVSLRLITSSTLYFSTVIAAVPLTRALKLSPPFLAHM